MGAGSLGVQKLRGEDKGVFGPADHARELFPQLRTFGEDPRPVRSIDVLVQGRQESTQHDRTINTTETRVLQLFLKLVDLGSEIEGGLPVLVLLIGECGDDLVGGHPLPFGVEPGEDLDCLRKLGTPNFDNR